MMKIFNIRNNFKNTLIFKITFKIKKIKNKKIEINNKKNLYVSKVMKLKRRGKE